MLNTNTPSLPIVAPISTSGNCCDGDGMWGNGGWWIILFALIFGWGRNGGVFGGGDGNGSCCAPATCADLQHGFDQQATTDKLNGLENGLAQAGYANLQQMNAIANGICQLGYQNQQAITQAQIASMQQSNALQAQLADYCCENRLAIANVRNDMATGTCAVTTAISNAARDITDNANANYRALHDEFVAFQMENKNDRIAELQSQVNALNLAASQQNQNRYLVDQLRPCPVPAYITCNPWGSNGYGGFGYGVCCNTGCGC